MFAALFSYSGRIGRTQFIIWSVVQAALSALMLAGANGLSSNTIADLQSGGDIGSEAPKLGLMLVLSVALAVLPASALMIKRLRDVGLPPWPVFIVIAIVDTLIASFVPHSTPVAAGPFAGLAFSMVVTVLLALVPGRLSLSMDDAPADWVERAAAAAEAKLEQGRRPKLAAAQKSALDQLQALETLRRQRTISQPVEPQGFGRRRANRT